MAQQTKKWKTWHIVILSIIGVFIFLILLIAGIAISNTKNETRPVLMKETIVATKENWKSLGYEKQQKWIEDQLQSRGTNVTDADISMKHLVQNKFNYPKEVEFDLGSTPMLQHGEVTLADEGIAFVHGTGTAKNAFGVKSAFAYSIRLKILPDTMYIDDVSISKR